MAGCLEAFDLLPQDEARIERIVLLGHDDDLREARSVDGHGLERSEKHTEIVIGIARRPETAGLLDAIAARIHDEHRGRKHHAALGNAEKILAPEPLAPRMAVHVEHERVDPLHGGIGREKLLGFFDGE